MKNNVTITAKNNISDSEKSAPRKKSSGISRIKPKPKPKPKMVDKKMATDKRPFLSSTAAKTSADGSWASSVVSHGINCVSGVLTLTISFQTSSSRKGPRRDSPPESRKLNN